MANEPFRGFHPTMIQFLDELASHNNRDWFTKHKPRYESDVLAPALAFIESMQAPLAKLSPHFIANPSPSLLPILFSNPRFVLPGDARSWFCFGFFSVVMRARWLSVEAFVIGFRMMCCPVDDDKKNRTEKGDRLCRWSMEYPNKTLFFFRQKKTDSTIDSSCFPWVFVGLLFCSILLARHAVPQHNTTQYATPFPASLSLLLIVCRLQESD